MDVEPSSIYSGSELMPGDSAPAQAELLSKLTSLARRSTHEFPRPLRSSQSHRSIDQQFSSAMAQKIVIKVHMGSDKCRRKAMSLVAATGGVVSVELAGDDRSKVVVVGEVDSVKLTSLLRRKVGPAELVEVGDAKPAKKEEKKEEKKPETVPPYYYYYPYHHYSPYGYIM
ncbi:Os02g0585100 [Oryza sativa Japonica Group]|uniref:Os02g0585100 protein n=6 Tax=Oryza TaxID=4527 RepID=Q0E010_ORYSJ|nr:Os02g0585100 [Oryza sativa Japonica Group]|eukprot:NP_001047264.1 Os02g0585100 [Oryza sativa Japonica Group]